MIRYLTGSLRPVVYSNIIAVPYCVVRFLRSTATEAEKRFLDKVHQKERNKRRSSPEWLKRKESLVQRYGHWSPTRKLSRQQMQDIRSLKDQMPYMRTIDFANHFKVSPEAIRRILRSKWIPNDKEEELLQARNTKHKETKKKKAVQEILQPLESTNTDELQESKFPSSSSSVESPKMVSEASANIKSLTYGSTPKRYSKKLNLRTRPQKKPYTSSVSDVID